MFPNPLTDTERLGPICETLGHTLKGMALWYEAADLFVLPTTALECFGLITMEAFAHGCPVLSTDAAAVPESMRPIMPT